MCLYTCDMLIVAAAAGRIVWQSSVTGRLHPARSEPHIWHSAGQQPHGACQQTNAGGARHCRQAPDDTQWARVITDVTGRHYTKVWQWPSNIVNNCHVADWSTDASAHCSRLSSSLVHSTEFAHQGLCLFFYIHSVCCLYVIVAKKSWVHYWVAMRFYDTRRPFMSWCAVKEFSLADCVFLLLNLDKMWFSSFSLKLFGFSHALSLLFIFNVNKILMILQCLEALFMCKMLFFVLKLYWQKTRQCTFLGYAFLTAIAWLNMLTNCTWCWQLFLFAVSPIPNGIVLFFINVL